MNAEMYHSKGVSRGYSRCILQARGIVAEISNSAEGNFNCKKHHGEARIESFGG